ncbi:MAG: Clp protease N-terminal domain-containing protein [Hyphomicrobiaceae bacterium]|nr:Clp protease N-terminal domain-containing protein [Hyphomicrobiaceae bacterium]
MQYKGDDLDLRVAQSRGLRESYMPDYEPANASNGRWSRPRSVAPQSAEPLWVDEILLACCNYAFDVAQANGAAEVDLEHLVNALTRVDAAARILEARGVHEGQLRRESATLIASEIPAANAGDAIAPRRSPDLEDVLRRASDLAHRRGYAAGVDDVLWVLLHYGRDLAVVHLLRRHTPDWQRADWGRIREPVPPQPEPQPMPRPVPLSLTDGLASRVVGIEDGLRLLQAEMAADRKLLMDLVRDIQRDVVAQRSDGAAFRGDLGQRLESLERAVQTRGDSVRLPALLTERLSGLEKALHTGLGETSRAAAQFGQRLAAMETAVGDGQQTAHQALAERLAALERSIGTSLGDVARSGSQIGQRLAAMETAIANERNQSAQGLADRMTALEKSVLSGLGEGARNWAHLGQRLNALEAGLAERDSAPLAKLGERLTTLEGALDKRLASIERLAVEARAVDLPKAVGDRLGSIERRLETASGETGRRWSELTDRLGSLGRIIETVTGESNRVRLELAERFAGLEADLASQAFDKAEVPPELVERLAGLERAVRAGFGDAAVTTTRITERLGAVEQAVSGRPADQSEALLILDDRLGSIERMLEARGNEMASTSGQILERLRILESRPAPTQPPPIDIAAVVSPLQTRIDGLHGSSMAKVDAVGQSLVQVLARIGQVEDRLKSEAVVNEEALKGRDQDFDFIYAEIKQLGQSQATLNSAVNDWRNESQTHFGTLAGRLDKLQAAVAPPEPQPIVLPAVVAKTANGTVSGAVVDPVVRPAAAAASTAGPRPATDTVRADGYDLPSQPGRGFWYWLFGTDDVSRSHRESDLKVDRMRQNMRETKERRRGQA